MTERNFEILSLAGLKGKYYKNEVENIKKWQWYKY